MLFVRSPHDIYRDIFNLTKLGFSAEYIERISPAERGIFKMYHELDNKKDDNAENAKAAELVGLNIEDL